MSSLVTCRDRSAGRRQDIRTGGRELRSHSDRRRRPGGRGRFFLARSCPAARHTCTHQARAHGRGRSVAGNSAGVVANCRAVVAIRCHRQSRCASAGPGGCPGGRSVARRSAIAPAGDVGADWRRLTDIGRGGPGRAAQGRLGDARAAAKGRAVEARCGAAIRLREDLPPWLCAAVLWRSGGPREVRGLRQLPGHRCQAATGRRVRGAQGTQSGKIICVARWQCRGAEMRPCEAETHVRRKAPQGTRSPVWIPAINGSSRRFALAVREIAREEKMPAYIVCWDRTLAEIAKRRPRSIAALRNMPGVGPAKAERYGEKFLAVIRQTEEPEAA